MGASKGPPEMGMGSRVPVLYHACTRRRLLGRRGSFAKYIECGLSGWEYFELEWPRRAWVQRVRGTVVSCIGYVPCRKKAYFFPLGNHVGSVREQCPLPSVLVWVWNVVNGLAVAGRLRGPGLCHIAGLSAGLGGTCGPQRLSPLSPGSTLGGGWLGRRGRRQANLDIVLGLNHDFCATPCDEGVFVRSMDPLVKESRMTKGYPPSMVMAIFRFFLIVLIGEPRSGPCSAVGGVRSKRPAPEET